MPLMQVATANKPATLAGAATQAIRKKGEKSSNRVTCTVAQAPPPERLNERIEHTHHIAKVTGTNFSESFRQFDVCVSSRLCTRSPASATVDETTSALLAAVLQPWRWPMDLP